MKYYRHDRNGNLAAGKVFDSVWKEIPSEFHAELTAAYQEKALVPDPALAGEEVHIFGTGPSLNELAAKCDWTGITTIGVNTAPLSIKSLDYWICTDALTYDWLEEWAKTTSTKTCIRRRLYDHFNWKSTHLFHHAQGGPCSDIKGGLWWGCSSVLAAMDYARHCKVAAIYLWGLDYNDHNHAAGPPGSPWKDFNRITRDFEVMRSACKTAGIEVFNCNLNSRLKVFPFKDIMSHFDFTEPEQSGDYSLIDWTQGTIERNSPSGSSVVRIDSLPKKDQTYLRKLANIGIPEGLHNA